MNKMRSVRFAAVAAVVSGVAFAAELEIPQDGLVSHIDASRIETLDFNAANEVVGWHSRVGDVAYTNNLAVDTYEWYWTGGGTYEKWWTIPCRRPYYDATALDGKPGVVFGYEQDGTTKITSWLYSNQMVMHGTVFFVSMPHSDDARYTSQVGLMGGLYNARTAVETSNAGSSMGYPCFWSLGTMAKGEGGRGFLDGRKVYDYNEGLTDLVRFCEDGTRRANVLAFVTYDQYIKYGNGYAKNQVVIGDYYIQFGRPFRGPISEMVVYDRQLTDEEAVKVSKLLMFKWFGGTTLPARWTGKGATTAWSDPDNWEGEVVPAAGAPIILSNATVTVNGPVTVGQLAVFDTVSITISGEGTFSCTGVSDCSADDAELFVSGSGSFVKTGRGTTKLIADTTANLTVRDGILDLNGHSVSCVDVTGDGAITNSSDTLSTISVSGRLTTHVRGNVSVRFTGEGDRELLAYNTYTGATVLDGGKLTTVTNVAPGSIAGLVMHIDASQPETITTNADGEVVAWRSTLDDGLVFSSIHDPDETRYSTHAPYMSKDPATGLPAVLFGRTKDLSSSTGTVLSANLPIEHRTLIFVANILSKTTVGTESSAPFGSFRQIYGCTTKNASGLTASSGTQQRYSAYSYALHDRGRAWVNGRYLWNWTNCVGKTAVAWGKVTDPETQYSPDTTDFSLNWNGTKSGSWGYSHVIVSVADTNSYTYVPALGTGVLGSKFQAGYVSEALVYNRILTDEEIMRISAAMMEKWQVKQSDESGFIRAENTYPPASPLVVTADSTLDLHSIPQTIAQMAFDAGSDISYPSLALIGIPDGVFDVTETALSLKADGEPTKSATILTAPGARIDGPFASVDPSDAVIRYKGDSVRISIGGLLMLVR